MSTKAHSYSYEGQTITVALEVVSPERAAEPKSKIQSPTKKILS